MTLKALCMIFLDYPGCVPHCLEDKVLDGGQDIPAVLPLLSAAPGSGIIAPWHSWRHEMRHARLLLLGRLIHGACPVVHSYGREEGH